MAHLFSPFVAFKLHMSSLPNTRRTKQGKISAMKLPTPYIIAGFAVVAVISFSAAYLSHACLRQQLDLQRTSMESSLDHFSVSLPINQSSSSPLSGLDEHGFHPSEVEEHFEHEEDPLLWLWKGIETNHSGRHWTLSNAIPPLNRTKPSLNDITLVTHCSTDRLERVLLQAQRWTGPLSVAVYIRSKENIHEFFSFVKNHTHDFRNAAFHVYAENDVEADGRQDEEALMAKGYPQNILRNVATGHIDTDYLLALDADLVTQKDAHQRLRNILGNESSTMYRAIRQRTFFVLAAFEGEEIPDSKAEVVQAYREEKAIGFHMDVFPVGHGTTNFRKWTRNRSGPYYRVRYFPRFEPYVLAFKHGLPRYYEPLRSGYYDKISFFVEARYIGYKFLVLRDFFVFHQNKYINRPTWYPAHLTIPFQYFLKHLISAYNLSEPRNWAEAKEVEEDYFEE